MKQRYLLELDSEASIQSNLDFLEKCAADIRQQKKKLKKKQKLIPNNQIDLIDAIRETEK